MGSRVQTVGIGLVLVAMVACTGTAGEAPIAPSGSAPSSPPSPASVLRSISQLREMFNADQGLTRLVLLLSPT